MVEIRLLTSTHDTISHLHRKLQRQTIVGSVYACVPGLDVREKCSWERIFYKAVWYCSSQRIKMAMPKSTTLYCFHEMITPHKSLCFFYLRANLFFSWVLGRHGSTITLCCLLSQSCNNMHDYVVNSSIEFKRKIFDSANHPSSGFADKKSEHMLIHKIQKVSHYSHNLWGILCQNENLVFFATGANRDLTIYS